MKQYIVRDADGDLVDRYPASAANLAMARHLAKEYGDAVYEVGLVRVRCYRCKTRHRPGYPCGCNPATCDCWCHKQPRFYTPEEFLDGDWDEEAEILVDDYGPESDFWEPPQGD